MCFFENILDLSFLQGIIFLIVSIIMHFYPPKKINHLYGYRTKSSMKNDEVWQFAQKHTPIQMFKVGLFMLIISIIGYIVNITEEIRTIISVVLLILSVIYLLATTEKAIKNKFKE